MHVCEKLKGRPGVPQISFSEAATTPKEIHKFEKINLRSFWGAPCPPDPDGPPQGRRAVAR